MTKRLYKCMTKATTAEGDQRQYGPTWLFARRGTLEIHEDFLQCGDWHINYLDIKKADLYSFQSFLLRIPGYVLTIETDDRTYHFGLNGWGRFWKEDLPFEVRRESGTLRFTWFSLLVRLILIGLIVYSFWDWATFGG